MTKTLPRKKKKKKMCYFKCSLCEIVFHYLIGNINTIKLLSNFASVYSNTKKKKTGHFVQFDIL